ncbi:unnamed protein product [Caenorhabditis angaria]|uniref:Nuclear pore complex protein Nup214 phenylalanine-glycine (FG) domain-containing protein n=1 Tax=Caenorhabditis angaria TaxID=860376 RepID=A0A9P1MWA1_9PELO|nr:unnamed protein product [Caenorhabditis angaria]
MTDTLDVTDFFFETCRKFRLSQKGIISENTQKSIRNRLTSSSSLGVTFAVVQENQILCFPTKSIFDNKLTKENMNVEVTNLNVKTLNFPSIQRINEIGVNSDGNLLAILHTTNNNVFVDIYQIQTICQTDNLSPFSKIRVGTDPNNQGSAFEWNPAFPDTFAVSSTDNSVLVAKIDLKDGSKQSVIGAIKMGAIATVISWSPKGKQLTIGDSCGKVTQLKPELDVVRSILTPENNKKYHYVTGLCWLATTEWIVSYSKDLNGNDHDSYLMKCKKDKPTEWILLNELSYSNEKSPIPASILTSTQLLIEWNVILSANTKTSQIIPVGKKQEDWQTWGVPEGKEIYLPTSSSDTFPIGITIDRSNNSEIMIGFDGSAKKYPASPVVMILNNEGVLSAFHIISTSSKSCQLSLPNHLSISGLKELSNISKPQNIVNNPVKVIEVSKEKVKEVVIPPVVPTPTVPVSKPIAPTTPIVPKTPVKPKNDDESKQKLIDYVSKIDELIKTTSGEVGKLQIASQNTNKTICETSDIIKSSNNDAKNVLNELTCLMKSIEEITDKSTHAVKELDFVVEEQMNLISEAENPENALETLRDLAEAEKLMKFNKFETSADLLNEKYVQCCELLKKIRFELVEKEAKRKTIFISPLTSGFLNQRLESQTEIETTLKQEGKKENEEEIKKEKIEENNIANGIVRNIEKPAKMEAKTLTKENIISSRLNLIQHLKQRKPVETKKVKLITFSDYSKQSKATNKTSCDISTANLTNAILKLSMTPRRQPIHSSDTTNISICSKTADATTQADAPPVVVNVKSEEPKTPPKNERKSVGTSKPTTPQVIPNSQFSGSFMGSAKVDVKPLPSTSFLGQTKSTNDNSTSPAVKPLLSTPNIVPTNNLLSTKSVITPDKPPITSITPVPSVAAEIVPEIKTSPPSNSQPTTPALPATKPVVETTPTQTPTVLPATENKTDTILEVKPSQPSPAAEIKTSTVIETKPQTENVLKTEPVATTEEPKKESGFVFGQATKTPETKKESLKPAFSFGSASTNTTTPKSLFGGSTPTSSTNSSSIFGGAAKTNAFGGFGQQQNAQQSQQNSQPASVGFSFNKPAPTTTGFGGFGGNEQQTAKPTGFAAAAAVAATTDIGMEDDTNIGTSGGFMSGLGSNNQNQNSTNTNIFSSKPATNTSSTGNSWLFSNNSGQQQQQNKPSNNSFSFASAAAQHAQQPVNPTNPSSMFGSAAKFGGSPAFGSKPAFGGGAAPGGGFLSKDASIFGGNTNNTGTAAGGFSQFAAASGSSSIFGGGTTTNQNKPASSLFGGSSSNAKGSFNSWR